MSASPTHSEAATPTGLSPTTTTNSTSPDNTDSITIILSIIGAILTLASVIVAILQYRIQSKRRRDVENGGHVVEMNPYRSVQERESAMTTPLSYVSIRGFVSSLLPLREADGAPQSSWNRRASYRPTIHVLMASGCSARHPCSSSNPVMIARQ